MEENFVELGKHKEIKNWTPCGALAPPEFVTSSYLQSTVQALLRIDSELEKERAEIRRVFNLQDIRLLTEGVRKPAKEVPSI